MAKRVTIMIPEDLDKKLRLKQAEIIRKSQAGISYSKVLSLALRGKVKL